MNYKVTGVICQYIAQVVKNDICLNLYDRVWTISFSLAFFALTSSPYFVEFLNSCIYYIRCVGYDSGFKIPPIQRFHFHTGTGKIGTPNVTYFLVND